jgi:hypothetical protein
MRAGKRGLMLIAREPREWQSFSKCVIVLHSFQSMVKQVRTLEHYLPYTFGISTRFSAPQVTLLRSGPSSTTFRKLPLLRSHQMTYHGFFWARATSTNTDEAHSLAEALEFVSNPHIPASDLMHRLSSATSNFNTATDASIKDEDKLALDEYVKSINDFDRQNCAHTYNLCRNHKMERQTVRKNAPYLMDLPDVGDDDDIKQPEDALEAGASVQFASCERCLAYSRFHIP